MKRILAIAICLLVVLGQFAFAGAAPVRVKVPFQFYAGGESLPAGEYVIDILDDSHLTIWDVEGRSGCFVLMSREANLSDLKDLTVGFNRYGKQYFLTSVSNGHFKASVLKSVSEKMAAQKETKGTVVASLAK